MDYTGKWVVALAMTMDEDGNKAWVNEEEFKKSPAYDPDDPDSASAFSTAFFFDENGNVNMLMKIPEGVSPEDLEEAVASGEVEIIDGMMKTKEDSIKWKEEDGKLLICLDGSWNEAQIEDGLMEFMFYKLKKAD